jgi:hypothetical protein
VSEDLISYAYHGFSEISDAMTSYAHMHATVPEHTTTPWFPPAAAPNYNQPYDG